MAACGRLEPVVKVAEGLLKGRVAQSKSHRGGKYLSFQGIPYGQPPVGPLRFAAPKCVLPWSGIKDATKEGPVAPSQMMGSTTFNEESDEDCLRLNVYTSQLPGGDAASKRPVMVWIHGGGFAFGSGNSDMFGPDHLVSEVVLVTINYRLGVLGFLSLQNETCPGNNGLRDQVEALRWVQRNISAFGGDAANVTIFGESAGGASVQYLMISPLAKGLFHRAITQSGSVLCPWARTHNPVKFAFKLGELLGLQTDDKDRLLEFLRILPARTLVTLSGKLMKKVQPEVYYLSNPFNPVVEPVSPDAFLCEAPENVIRQGKAHDVPYITGVNTLEGLIIAAGKPFTPLSTNEELQRLLPLHPNLKRGSPLADSILEKIKAHFLPNGWDAQRAADILSGVYFLAGNDEALIALDQAAAASERQSKTYFYRFTYDGGLSLFKNLMGFSDWKGTLHCDEIPCLLYSNLMSPQTEAGSADARAIDRMCQLWVDFAKTGDPTPATGDWTAYNNADKPCLDIGDQLTLVHDINAQDMQFWRDIQAEIDNSIPHKL